MRQQRTTTSSRPAVDVCVMADSTYPFTRGGVSSVIHQLVRELPDLTFGVVHLAWNATCPATSLYPSLPNLRWVERVLLAPETPPRQSVGTRSSGDCRRAIAADVDETIDMMGRVLDECRRGVFDAFWDMYRVYFNPMTRTRDFWRVYDSRVFVERLERRFRDAGISVGSLFWIQRLLMIVTTSLLDRVYPEAAVYHSQTQHYGGIAAVLAARQHRRRSIVTEHSLYVRDALNWLLRRPCDEPIHDPRETLRGVSDPQTSALGHWLTLGGEFVYANADVLTYQYERNIREARTLGAPLASVRRVVNGIDPAPLAPARGRQRGSIRPFVVGFVGRVVRLKGVTELIRAARLMHDAGWREVEFRVIGPFDEEPDYHEECLALARELGIDDRARFMGSRAVYEELREIDVLALPSHTEAFPIALLEAMAAGVPVVASDVGCVREALVDPIDVHIGAAGLVIPRRDPAALARGLMEVLSSRRQMARMSTNGPARVEARYRSDVVMNEYRRLYVEMGMSRGA